MVDLPTPYFIGSVALLGVIAVLLARFTWYEKIHGIARWWVSAYLSLIAISLAAFALSVIGHFAAGRLSLAVLKQDLNAAIAYLAETGTEAIFLAVVLVPLTITVLEIKRFQRHRSSQSSQDGANKRKRLLFGIALLVGPLFFFAGLASDANDLRISFFLLIPWLFSCPALFVAWLLNWCIENPTARLHKHLGMHRLAVASCIHGLFWLPALWIEFGARARQPVDVVLAGSQSLFLAMTISFVTWGVMNVIGWILDGFARRS